MTKHLPTKRSALTRWVLLLLVLLVGSTTSISGQEKKRKQRGKVVKATVVDDEGNSEEEAEAEAEAEAEEEAKAADRERDANERELAKELRKKEKEQLAAGRRADRERRKANEKAAREADKAASQQARQAARDQKVADRQARQEAERAAQQAAEAQRAERAAAAAATESEAQASAAAATAEPVSVTAAAEPDASISSAPAAAAEASAPAPTPRRVVREVPAAPAPAVVADLPPTSAPDLERDLNVSEQVVVREVLLDVLVNDNDGNLITGLQPEDFQVVENGAEREVISATFYGGPELAGSGRNGEVRTDRYFILFFHDQKQAAPFLTASQLDAGRWAQRWLKEELLPNDQVAVMGYDVRLKVYTDFTRDRDAIIKAAKDASIGRKEPDRWKTRSAPEFDTDSPSILANLPTGKALAKATRRFQRALELVGNAAEGIVGRKNMLLFSVGYGEVNTQFQGFTPDPRFYPDMKEALNNGNVAVYAIDTMGTQRGRPQFARIGDSLSAIATDTGGHYYFNFVNTLTPLRQVSEDNRGYYLISFRSEYDAGTQGYREVEVEVPGRKVDVRARKGYRYGSVALPTGDAEPESE